MNENREPQSALFAFAVDNFAGSETMLFVGGILKENGKSSSSMGMSP